MRTHICQVLKAVFASVLISLVFVLIFTVIIQLFALPAEAIKPVNQVFKVIAVALGVLICVKGEKGLIKGTAAGVLAIAATFIVFGLISMSFTTDWRFAIELLIGGISGALAGILAVNLKRKA